MRAFCGNAVIHRQSTEKRDKNENDSSNRGKRAGGEKCNSGLVAESLKIIDSGQTHYPPPGLLVVFILIFVRSFYFPHALQQPAFKSIVFRGSRLYILHVISHKIIKDRRRLLEFLRSFSLI
jgi:hypothetical protein